MVRFPGGALFLSLLCPVGVMVAHPSLRFCVMGRVGSIPADHRNSNTGRHGVAVEAHLFKRLWYQMLANSWKHVLNNALIISLRSTVGSANPS